MTETATRAAAETGGTEVTRFNALKHGILSRYTLLPWEDPVEYQLLIAALAAEHAPEGPTEEHLVEELAGILWRKRRLRMAEVASYRNGLHDRFSYLRDTAKAAIAHLRTTEAPESVERAVQATDADTRAELAGLDEDEAMTRQALDLLSSKRKDAYEAGLGTLRGDSRSWWQDYLDIDPDELEEGDEPPEPTATVLKRFLEDQVLTVYKKRREQLRLRPLIREQAFAESLMPFKLEKLSRYEVFLDRKLERMLAMLMRLKELRAARAEP